MPSKRVPRVPDPPCEHWDDQIGTVTAGDLYKGACCSVATCADCATKSAGYVTMRTGIVASPLLTYVEARRQSAEAAK